MRLTQHYFARGLFAFCLLSVVSVAKAQLAANYEPMDPIPAEVELPDPCDNPTTR